MWAKKGKLDGKYVCKLKLFGSVASPSSPRIRDVAEMILVMHKEKNGLSGQGSDISIEEYEAWTKSGWEIDAVRDRRHPAPFPLEIRGVLTI